MALPCEPICPSTAQCWMVGRCRPVSSHVSYILCIWIPQVSQSSKNITSEVAPSNLNQLIKLKRKEFWEAPCDEVCVKFVGLISHFVNFDVKERWTVNFYRVSLFARKEKFCKQTLLNTPDNICEYRQCEFCNSDILQLACALGFQKILKKMHSTI